MEGFSTLAVEVIAIRLATPVVGSSMTLTGVMLGVVLFALSAGYWHGGELSSRWEKPKIRSAVSRNLLLAGATYAALSFPWESMLLTKVLDWDWSLGLAIGVSAVVLFVLPVYLASQTVPMLAELTNTEGKAGKASGKVLFFSTIGSVGGGIITPVYLFPYVGVRATTYVICGLLVVASILIGVGHRWIKSSASIVIVTLLVSAGYAFTKPDNVRFAYDSAHQTIQVVEKKNDNGRMERLMYLNGGHASGIFIDNGETSFAYVREADRALAASKAAYVLAIGSAGFTFPRDASSMEFVREVDAVDVDPEVFRIAEQHFLMQSLSSKIRFYAMSGRNAVRKLERGGKHYGFTLLDAYSGMGIPDELLTVEFLSGIRSLSALVAANVIMDREVDSAFAHNTLASFQRAFGQVWIKDVLPGDSDYTNILLTNWAHDGSKRWSGAGQIYTDNRNTADRDHVKMIWGTE